MANPTTRWVHAQRAKLDRARDLINHPPSRDRDRIALALRIEALTSALTDVIGLVDELSARRQYAAVVDEFLMATDNDGGESL